jgi:ubiquinone/menaquinone biosynthesis C-methylase UbiE
MSNDYQEQVGRTYKKQSITNNVWMKTLDFVYQKMGLSDDSVLLDLCCGNGMLSVPFARKVKSIVAVDFSEPLLQILKSKTNNDINNITILHKDINKISVSDLCVWGFSHAIIYFSIQHFTEREAILLFEKMFKCLKPNGIFYIGDVPDRVKLWQFANTDEYAKMYFESVKNEAPVIGTWFLQEDLLKMAHYAGFSHGEIIEQPVYQINSRYRFDLKLIR